MTEPGGDDRKRVVLEALILGLGRSPVTKVVSIELIRGALEVNIEDVVVGDQVKLDAVWLTLEPLPGFDAKSAMPAFCWMKQNEAKLGMKVELPAKMSSISVPDRVAMAAMCPIKPRELDHVMSGHAAPAPGEITAPIELPIERQGERKTRPPLADGKKPTMPPSAEVMAKPAAPSPSKRKILGGVAGVAATLALAFTGMTLYRACDSSVQYKKIEGVDFAGLPVKDPRLLGTQVGVTLTDPSWTTRPEDERRKQMTEVFQRLQSRNVSVFYVQDQAQKTVASAQWRGRDIVVLFY